MTVDINTLQDAHVYDQDGDKIGSVGQVYVHDSTNTPSFVTVKTGLFGTKETFVPLNNAKQDDKGIQVPYTKDFVKDAPHVDADHHISPEEEDEIYRYYGLEDGNDTGAAGRTDHDGRNAAAAGTAGAAGAAGAAHHESANDRRRDEDALRRDDAALADEHRRDADANNGEGVVRREEEVRVGKERVSAGRARLRKHVVTEHKTVTVPVEREEVEVVREPLDGNASGASLTDEEQTVSLTEERPVVEKQVVDKERVGLQTNTVRGEEQVETDVSREEVTLDTDGRTDVDKDGKRR